MGITYAVDVFVKLKGQPGVPDFSEWREVGVVHESRLQYVCDQFPGIIVPSWSGNRCKIVDIKDGPMVALTPATKEALARSTEIRSLSDLLDRCRKEVQRLMVGGEYVSSNF